MNWKTPIFSLILALLGITTFAQDFKAANQLFDAKKYADATAEYEKIEPKTAHVYFNLGNAYYRQEQLGRAIVNYARARRIAPRDPDILANLKFAEDRLGVTEVNSPSRPVQRLWQSIIGSRTFREWSGYELATLWLMLAAIGLAIWISKWRTAFITMAVVFLVGWGVSAMALSVRQTEAPHAIVLTAHAEARFAPQPEATVHFPLTEGTEVAVREDRGQWLFVERADGQQGWVRAETVERI